MGGSPRIFSDDVSFFCFHLRLPLSFAVCQGVVGKKTNPRGAFRRGDWHARKKHARGRILQIHYKSASGQHVFASCLPFKMSTSLPAVGNASIMAYFRGLVLKTRHDAKRRRLPGNQPPCSYTHGAEKNYAASKKSRPSAPPRPTARMRIRRRQSCGQCDASAALDC